LQVSKNKSVPKRKPAAAATIEGTKSNQEEEEEEECSNKSRSGKDRKKTLLLPEVPGFQLALLQKSACGNAAICSQKSENLLQSAPIHLFRKKRKEELYK
jgi:hypothetical protein